MSETNSGQAGGSACSNCNGTGQDNDPGDANGGGGWLDAPCPCCRGKGWTVSDLEYHSETECPRCEGTGLSPNTKASDANSVR